MHPDDLIGLPLETAMRLIDESGLTVDVVETGPPKPKGTPGPKRVLKAGYDSTSQKRVILVCAREYNT